MSWIVKVILVIVVALGVGLAITPARFAIDQVRKSDPAVSYASASGTVWNGQVRDVMYGIQPVGNVSFNTIWSALLQAAFASHVELTGGSITGQGVVSAGLGETYHIPEFRVRGSTRDILNLQTEIRNLNGQFTVNVSDVRIEDDQCLSANGTVWTDILTRTETSWSWRGPELTGPISCENGQLHLALLGESETGERVTANLQLGLDASGSFFAEVFTQNMDTANALSLLGFVSEGENRFTYRHAIE